MSKIHLTAALGVVTAVAVFSANSQNVPAPPGHPAASRPASGPAGHGPALSAERAEELTAFAKKHMPEMYEQLEKLKDRPERYRGTLQVIERTYSVVQRYPENIREAVIARGRVNYAIYRLQREYRQATDPAVKSGLAEKLRDLLAEQFDKDQIVKEYDLTRLAKQLADLKAVIEQRRQNRQKTIDENLKRLLAPESRPAARGDDQKP
jgi:predicted O-linked N-acetylglucosamine transferase (SPINDLY family)